MAGESNIKPCPVFALGTGRCGTHFLVEAMGLLDAVDAHHIRELDGDSFYRYCAWNNLEVDIGGLVDQRARWIKESVDAGKLYFESNPYLSFHVPALYRHLGAKFVLILRNPEDVVRSHVVKGWYETDPVVYDNNRSAGFQYGMKMNHFLGRIIPYGDEFLMWRSLTRIGRLAWMWNRVNLLIRSQLIAIPEDSYRIVKIEKLSYQGFLELLDFTEVMEKPNRIDFYKIKMAKPGKGKSKEKTRWSDREAKEFEEQTKTGRHVFGY